MQPLGRGGTGGHKREGSTGGREGRPGNLLNIEVKNPGIGRNGPGVQEKQCSRQLMQIRGSG